MRFLADENFPQAGVLALEGAGCDVYWIRRAAPGMRDAEILAWAEREQRVLLTFDKDFGELARATASRSLGVILFRLPMPRPGSVGRELAGLVLSRGDWSGHFSVVEPGRIRMRPIGISN